MTVEKGQWYRFADGRVAEVCDVLRVRAPKQDGDTEPRFALEAVVRMLDKDGAMGPSKRDFSVAFLQKHTVRVLVAPPIAV